jgi:tRNA-specific 2-thiouridylase
MDMIAVAMSGGVDSSLAAYLLKSRQVKLPFEPSGANEVSVVGASQNIWTEGCRAPTTLALADEVCRKIGIPYYLIDMGREFKEIIVDDFVSTYLHGRTPNPCVICNRRIKFGLFYRRIETTLRREGRLEEGARLYFATGHYARIEPEADGWALRKGVDREKDQSYMLYRLPRDLLPDLAFPLGELTKTEVVEMARQLDLPSVKAASSQDACFLEGSYGDFIVSHIGAGALRQTGEIVDTRGKVLGRHRGYVFYTVGQRRGLGLGNGPWYVKSIDAARNRIIVGRKREILSKKLEVADTNWLIGEPQQAFACGVKLRYQSGELACRVEPQTGGRVRILLKKGAVVTPGQSAVFYDGDRALGGGIIV